jgi:hypothetical protein
VASHFCRGEPLVYGLCSRERGGGEQAANIYFHYLCEVFRWFYWVVSFIPGKKFLVSNGYDVAWPPESVRTLCERGKSPTFAGNRIWIHRFSNKYLGRYTDITCSATVRERNILWTWSVLFWVGLETSQFLEVYVIVKVKVKVNLSLCLTN